MGKQMFVKDENLVQIGIYMPYIPATSQEIDEAAGVAELRAQR
jgi:hypothetical protein